MRIFHQPCSRMEHIFIFDKFPWQDMEVCYCTMAGNGCYNTKYAWILISCTAHGNIMLHFMFQVLLLKTTNTVPGCYTKIQVYINTVMLIQAITRYKRVQLLDARKTPWMGRLKFMSLTGKYLLVLSLT